jgi:hypothetical protein
MHFGRCPKYTRSGTALFRRMGNLASGFVTNQLGKVTLDLKSAIIINVTLQLGRNSSRSCRIGVDRSGSLKHPTSAPAGVTCWEFRREEAVSLLRLLHRNKRGVRTH